jgi:Dit-like phage tail protein
MRPLGFVLPAAAIGLGSLLIKPQRRGFYPVNTKGPPLKPLVAQVTLEERHFDEMMITDHPVEMGAVISDHAYQLPSTVVIKCAWSNSPSQPGGLLSQAVGLAGAALPGVTGTVARVIGAAGPTLAAAQSLLNGNEQSQVREIYKQLLDLYARRELFDIYTGKRIYHNMLFRSIAVDTDERSENILAVTATCREVLISTTSAVTVANAANMKSPQKTAPDVDRGTQQLAPATGYQGDE